MNLAIIGASGMVGTEILKVLSEFSFPITQLYLVGSDKSVGKTQEFGGTTYTYISIEECLNKKPQIAIFSAGSDVSLAYAPRFAEIGCYVIDNSSAWRMEPQIKLVVPEINGDLLTQEDYIIANPNCSTIQLVMVLHPLHQKYGVRRVIVSTYQSISGTGMKAVKQLENERAGISGEMAYAYPIDKNVIPHCDVFLDNDYTKEEMKLTNETKKILDPAIHVSATAVRVPVEGGHSEAVNIEFETADFEIGTIRKLLHETEGVVLQDNPDAKTYPMPLYSKGRNEVFVGRIRKDFTYDRAINLWIVADNLRKGAATNTVQIALKLIEKGIVK